MAKKRSWFNLLKRFLLVADGSSRSEKKDERRKSRIFGRFKNERLASLSAAPSSPPKKKQNDSEEQKQKPAMDFPSTIACETPLENTTQVALWISGSSPQPSIDKYKNEFQELPPIKLCGPAPKSLEYELIQSLAATKIQSAFRGHLARKALRALKGLVRLQALIRGWAVRRQAMNTLKCLQTIVNIQSEVCAKRCDMVKGTHNNQENNLQEYTEKDIKVDSNSQKRWDDSLLSKEEATALSTNRRVAAIKRERIKEYWLNHRRSTESEQNKLSVKQRYWLEKWVDAQLSKREDFQDSNEVFSSTAKNREEFSSRRIKLRNLQKQYQIETMDSPMYVPRRSFHQRKRSIGEDGCLGSPAVPTYMAATESAKAKARSLSSPRLRPIPIDAYSEINSPYKHKLLSPISSINSEMTSNTQISRNINFSQRSPSLKATPGPVKSNNRSIKDLRLITECSLPN